MEYYQYFRLRSSPFQPAAPGRAVYFSPTHLEGLATLESGLSGELNGITMLTGEAGTGKTTLIYTLLQRDFKRVRIANIEDPKLSFLEIMRLVLTQLNLYSAGSTKLDYLKALDHLLELHGHEERIAIVVDEAQVLSDDVLEELRLLWNRGQRNGHRLQLVLVGQPELAERLRQPQLRQLNQRISSRGTLKPLPAGQAMLYVECLLTAQGGKCSSVFAPGALRRLLRRSDGIPRKINMLCHAAMVAAFYAGESKVSVKTAKKIADEYHDAVAITHSGIRRFRPVLPALVAGAALASLIGVGLRYRGVWSGWLHRTRVVGEAAAETVLAARPARQPTAQSVPAGAHQAAGAAASHTAVQAAPAKAAASTGTSAKSEVAALSATPAAAPIAATVTASVEPQPRRAAGPVEPSGYVTVKSGDTLEKLAIRYLGSKTDIDKLVAANPSLHDINQLSVGEVIYLPRGVRPKAAATTAEPADTASANDADY